jgi:copper chaperone CopZ
MDESQECANKINIVYRQVGSVDAIKNMEVELDLKTDKLGKEYSSLVNNDILKSLEGASLVCSSPVIMVAISIPYLGQSVAALCSSMATASVRIDTSLANAEPIFDAALTAKENLHDRIVELQES